MMNESSARQNVLCNIYKSTDEQQEQQQKGEVNRRRMHNKKETSELESTFSKYWSTKQQQQLQQVRIRCMDDMSLSILQRSIPFLVSFFFFLLLLFGTCLKTYVLPLLNSIHSFINVYFLTSVDVLMVRVHHIRNTSLLLPFLYV